MLSIEQKNIILKEMLENLELPDTAYERAKNRYEDIGTWLVREESDCKDFEPHIYSQGSFRLGTAIKPIAEDEEYDLDLAVELESGKTKENSTQKEIKNLIGEELEKYRQSKNIQKELDEKHRCWRLEYKDQLSFHIDVVPCIPAKEEKKAFIKEALLLEGINDYLSQSVANLTVIITDDRHPKYEQICDDWKISNPQGYAKWFEYRMSLAREFIEKRALLLEKTNIDELPVYQWKTPLQQAVQLLKRHRDFMYNEKSSDSKPISIIITTLAAKAYQGEADVSETVINILNRMDSLVNQHKPLIPNPVDPSEDFADRWYDEKYTHLMLKDNFDLWLNKAKVDFKLLFETDNSNVILERASQKFATKLGQQSLEEKLGITIPTIITSSKTSEFDTAPKPWLER